MSLALGKKSQAGYFYNPQRPLIIAHRGACGYIPEHTLQAYDVAEYMGADFIEPDLCPTKDGFLVINHEGLLNETTNVARIPDLAYLHTTKTFPSHSGQVTETGWFIEDFTLSQIKQLRAKQRLSYRPQTFNYLFQKITINEALDYAIVKNQERIRNGTPLLGVYIELKNPTYYNSIGHPVEDMLLKVLNDRNIDNIKGASEICPIILQCFEIQSLAYMSTKTDLPLVFLVESSNIVNMSQYADIVNGVGPNINLVFTPNGQANNFIQEAHDYDLQVHPWVIRDDQPYFANFTRQQTYDLLLNSKLDGIFDEFPDSASIYFSLSQGKINCAK